MAQPGSSVMWNGTFDAQPMQGLSSHDTTPECLAAQLQTLDVTTAAVQPYQTEAAVPISPGVRDNGLFEPCQPMC